MASLIIYIILVAGMWKMFEKAGMKLLPYQEFLKSVREEIPAMDGSSWRDADGNWEVLDTSQPIWRSIGDCSTGTCLIRRFIIDAGGV